MSATTLTADVLALDPEQATTEIVEALRTVVGRELRRRGGVVGHGAPQRASR